MTAPRKPGFVRPVAIGLTVLLGLYVGAYYAMVKPQVVLFPGSKVLVLYNSKGTVEINASYPALEASISPAFIRTLFAAANTCDRSIRRELWAPARPPRPHVWEPTP